MPDIVIRTIDNGWIVTAKDDLAKPYDTAYVESDGTRKAAFENIIWQIREQLCPDFGDERMVITFEKKD